MLYEKEIESKNGSWYLLKCAPYCTFDNLIKGVVLSLVDITNKKLLDETILSETLKTEFFSNLSHELRTPLNIILCTLQLLDTYTTGSEVNEKERKFKQYIGIMKQNCYRQLRLVNNMIDITKLDAGFFNLHLQNCNIVNVVESVTMSVAEYIKTKSIKLIFDTDIEECIMSCDPEKIERVILNLLSNSIKFTRSGGSMKVNMYDKGKNIIISIKDTGIGIPPDKLNIIFDRFRQVDRSLTRKQEGSGIGLSIVKSLVELHGGTISVRSEYGKGTEFIIILPIIVLPKDNDIFEVFEFESESQERIERIDIEFSDIYSLN
ncbi:sensor histidine kinase [Clostridium estertheticum]|uniref:histidine kinase n=2 Tax=Clostridium estertheticum TaxID=238834 RepID=A0A7Y3ST02_9CLOT|nr:sensor histidine kinase [Clostridium estertheticum]